MASPDHVGIDTSTLSDIGSRLRSLHDPAKGTRDLDDWNLTVPALSQH